MEKPWAMEELRLKSWQKLNLAINDSNTPCSILCKAVVVSGKGYCVLFTDLSRIWWHSAMENEYSDFFKKCNNNMTYAEKKLKDFIEHKVTKFAVLNGVSWTVPLVTSSTNGTSKPEDASLDAWSVTMHDETLSTKFTISWTFHLRTLPMDSVEHCTFNHIVQPMSFMVTSLWRKLQAATHEVERQASEIEVLKESVDQTNISRSSSNAKEPSDYASAAPQTQTQAFGMFDNAAIVELFVNSIDTNPDARDGMSRICHPLPAAADAILTESGAVCDNDDGGGHEQVVAVDNGAPVVDSTVTPGNDQAPASTDEICVGRGWRQVLEDERKRKAAKQDSKASMHRKRRKRQGGL
eukprot:m.260430 g.260430  ORF g.260430 m.260430 type:complete len:352 (+) comp19680_c0_seq4:101-1156(+)